MLAISDASAEDAIVGILVVLLVAAVVYGVGFLAKRTDLGGPAALLVALVGALLVLLNAL